MQSTTKPQLLAALTVGQRLDEVNSASGFSDRFLEQDMDWLVVSSPGAGVTSMDEF
jgi:hypothetical protein